MDPTRPDADPAHALRQPIRRVVIAGGGDERFPLLVDAVAEIQRQVHIDFNEPRDVLGTLDVAAQPENRISLAA